MAQLKIEITSRSLTQMWDEFSKFLSSVRRISMDNDQSTLALKTVLHLPDPKPVDKPARVEGLKSLIADFSSRLELGPNAYAVFSTLTDIAARPPESTHFQKNRNTIEKRAGRWLKELACHSKGSGFDLNVWLPTWEAGGDDRLNTVRN